MKVQTQSEESDRSNDRRSGVEWHSGWAGCWTKRLSHEACKSRSSGRLIFNKFGQANFDI